MVAMGDGMEVFLRMIEGGGGKGGGGGKKKGRWRSGVNYGESR